MLVDRRRTYRIGALTAAVLGGVALLIGVVPSRGQQGRPSVAIAGIGPSARVGRTHVRMVFDLPPGLQLGQNPRVRVVDASGRLEELLPALLLGRGPSGECYRDLNTHTYPAGLYRVSAELEYVDGRGSRQTLVSPSVTISVPGGNRTP